MDWLVRAIRNIWLSPFKVPINIREWKTGKPSVTKELVTGETVLDL